MRQFIRDNEFVYLASPRGDWTNILKIGYTSRHPYFRVKELDYWIDTDGPRKPNWGLLFARAFPNAKQVESKTHEWFDEAYLGKKELFDVSYNEILDFWNNNFSSSFESRDIYGHLDGGSVTLNRKLFDMSSQTLLKKDRIWDRLIWEGERGMFVDIENNPQSSKTVKDVVRPVIESRKHYEAFREVANKQIRNVTNPCNGSGRSKFEFFVKSNQTLDNHVISSKRKEWLKSTAYYIYWESPELNHTKSEVFESLHENIPGHVVVSFAENRDKIDMSNTFEVWKHRNKGLQIEKPFRV